jgi:hypothetical protein
VITLVGKELEGLPSIKFVFDIADVVMPGIDEI